MSEEQVSYRSASYFEIVNQGTVNWRDHRDAAYWEYRRKWQEYPVKRYHGDFPLHIDIDLTNACNLKCIMCPRTHYIESHNKNWSPDGKIGFMTAKLFHRVVDQAAAEGAYSIKLNYLGEPLLHPRVVELIDLAARRGLWVMMNTNAVLLSEEMSARLIGAGLSDIFFSVDSPYPREYERIRVGAKFDQVIDNIRKFVQVKNRLGAHHIQTRASMVLDSGPEARQTIDDYKNLFTDLGVAEIGFGLPSEMNLDYWKEYGRIPGFVCADPYNRLFVYWDGLVGPCCGHWERGYVMGDANTENIKDIWVGRRYRLLREIHEQGRYDRIPICRECSVPWLSTQEVSS